MALVDQNAVDPELALMGLRARVAGGLMGLNPNDPDYLQKLERMGSASHLMGSAADRMAAARAQPTAAPAKATSERPASEPAQPESAALVGQPTTAAPAPVTMGVQPQMGQHRSFLSKLGHGLARAADVAGSVFAPEAMAFIPGTTIYKNLTAERQAGQELAREKIHEPEVVEAQKEAFGTEHPKPLTLAQQEGAAVIQPELRPGVEAVEQARHPAGAATKKGTPEQQAIDAQVILDDPNSTPEQKAAAQRNLQSIEKVHGALHPAAQGLFASWQKEHPGGTASQFMAEQARLRGQEGFGAVYSQRQMDWFDPATNTVFAGSMFKPAGVPGAVPSSPGITQKALQGRQLLNDLSYGIDATEAAIQGIDKPFSAAEATQLQVALRQPNTAAGAAAMQELNKLLTPAQQNYVVQLQALRENAVSLRVLLGSGRLLEAQAEAIMNALPGPAAPSQEFARSQLERLRHTLGQLETGVPHFQGEKLPFANYEKAEAAPGGGKHISLENFLKEK